jgi:hypothetical protein
LRRRTYRSTSRCGRSKASLPILAPSAPQTTSGTRGRPCSP